MERPHLAYWIVTGLFSAFMIFSSIGGIMLDERTLAYLHDHLGYPPYFIQWISVAKVLGAVAILLPVEPARIKEWAYFGFFIDLVTALCSFIAVGDPITQWWPMFLFIGVLVWAYRLHHRKLAEATK